MRAKPYLDSSYESASRSTFLNIKLEDSISLDKFIVCESNKHSLQFIENSFTEDSISNLFYIWGEEGVGKSYLMKAINKEYRKLNKKRSTSL